VFIGYPDAGHIPIQGHDDILLCKSEDFDWVILKAFDVNGLHSYP